MYAAEGRAVSGEKQTEISVRFVERSTGIFLIRTQERPGGAERDGSILVMPYAGFWRARSRAAAGRWMISAETLSNRGLGIFCCDGDVSDADGAFGDSDSSWR
jgi:hypothetical protein